MNSQLNNLPLNHTPIVSSIFPPTMEKLSNGNSSIPVNNIMSLLNVQNSSTSMQTVNGKSFFFTTIYRQPNHSSESSFQSGTVPELARGESITGMREKAKEDQ